MTQASLPPVPFPATHPQTHVLVLSITPLTAPRLRGSRWYLPRMPWFCKGFQGKASHPWDIVVLTGQGLPCQVPRDGVSFTLPDLGSCSTSSNPRLTGGDRLLLCCGRPGAAVRRRCGT